MTNIFEVKDKTGRKIRLTKRQWSHIRKKHPEVDKYELMEETVSKPDKTTDYDIDESVKYYYKYYKDLPSPYRFMRIIAKYLNGEGFLISAHFVRTMQ